MNAQERYAAVLKVLDFIGAGKTMTAACREATLAGSPITPMTVKKAIASSPELQEAYTNATQAQHDAWVDRLVDMENDPDGCSDPKMAAVLSKNLHWVLGRLDRQRFGDRVEVNHHLTADKAIVTALSRAKDRAALPAPVIDAVFEEVADTADDDLSFIYG